MKHAFMRATTIANVLCVFALSTGCVQEVDLAEPIDEDCDYPIGDSDADSRCETPSLDAGLFGCEMQLSCNTIHYTDIGGPAPHEDVACVESLWYGGPAWAYDTERPWPLESALPQGFPPDNNTTMRTAHVGDGTLLRQWRHVSPSTASGGDGRVIPTPPPVRYSDIEICDIAPDSSAPVWHLSWIGQTTNCRLLDTPLVCPDIPVLSDAHRSFVAVDACDDYLDCPSGVDLAIRSDGGLMGGEDDAACVLDALRNRVKGTVTSKYFDEETPGVGSFLLQENKTIRVEPSGKVLVSSVKKSHAGSPSNDSVSAEFSLQRCALKPASYFDSCLAALHEVDFDASTAWVSIEKDEAACRDASNWLENCVDAEAVCQ
jgi:hypothetical protein